MSNEEVQERIDQLEYAQDLLYEAIEQIQAAIRRTDLEAGAEAYIIPTLKMAASSEHEYLGSQPYNVTELIEALKASEDDEE